MEQEAAGSQELLHKAFQIYNGNSQSKFGCRNYESGNYGEKS